MSYSTSLNDVESVEPMAVIERNGPDFQAQDVRRFLARLQSAGEEPFGAVACREACTTLGFSKAMFSRVSGASWTPEHVYVRPDLEDGFHELRRAVDGTPVPLLRAPREADLVRYRRPYLLGRRAYHRGAYRPLIDLSDPAAYAAAPIVANGRTVAILHVDRNRESVTDDDLRLLLIATRISGLLIGIEENSRQLEQQRDLLAGMVAHIIDADTDRPGRVFRSVRAEQPAPGTTAFPAAPESLTAREEEVLGLLATGAGNRQIAAQLFISDGTVKAHIRRIFRKIGVESRAQAAAYHRRTRLGPTFRT